LVVVGQTVGNGCACIFLNIFRLYNTNIWRPGEHGDTRPELAKDYLQGEAEWKQAARLLIIIVAIWEIYGYFWFVFKFCYLWIRQRRCPEPRSYRKWRDIFEMRRIALLLGRFSALSTLNSAHPQFLLPDLYEVLAKATWGLRSTARDG